MTHQRRTRGKAAISVTFSDDVKLTMKKDHFLSNSSNMQSFINMWKAQEGQMLLSWGTTLISLFYCAITQKWALKNFFSAWARGKFSKTTCLELETSEGEAGLRRVQQHFLYPCNPWMWYYFSPSRDWKGDLSEEILWEPSLSQSSYSVQQHICIKEGSYWSWWEGCGLPLQW